jgi:upstream activation factor subunit UAF30
MECFSVIQKEREGPSSEEETPRPSKDLLKSDFLHPSSPPQKRKLNSSPPVPSKKVRASSPPTRPKPSKSNVKVEYDSDEDARFAAELDQALNSGSMRKTRGAASGTRGTPRTKKTKNEDGDVPKKKRAPNPNSAFHAPMLLSPQLTDVVFETELSRPVGLIKMD